MPFPRPSTAKLSIRAKAKNHVADAILSPSYSLSLRSFSRSRHLSSSKPDMTTLLWGYARIPFMLASGLGVLLSGALFYYQKYVPKVLCASPF